MALPLLFAMVLHEYAHGWVANRYGDPTARLAGRLTLNPLAHIDPFGTVILPLLCLLLPGGFFIGWAKPVPINAARLRNPRRDMALVAAAGPAMNLLLAVASALLFRMLLSADPSVASYLGPQREEAPPHTLSSLILLPLAAMSLYSVLINVLLMIFNLLPIPPLDGGRILSCVLPSKSAFALARLEPYGMMIILGLIVFDPQLHLLHTVTGTLVDMLATSIVTTVLR
jgi:Zn-dependent protease